MRLKHAPTTDRNCQCRSIPCVSQSAHSILTMLGRHHGRKQHEQLKEDMSPLTGAVVAHELGSTSPVSASCSERNGGLTEYTNAVLKVIGNRDPRHLVLVAQSLGGCRAPLVCERVPVRAPVVVNK